MVVKNEFFIKIICFLLLCSLISCKKEIKEISILRNQLGVNANYDEYTDYFPLKFKLEHSNDTVWSVVEGKWLYRHSVFRLLDYEDFVENVVTDVHENGFLIVDSVFLSCVVNFKLCKMQM